MIIIMKLKPSKEEQKKVVECKIQKYKINYIRKCQYFNSNCIIKNLNLDALIVKHKIFLLKLEKQKK
jgi:hypothetical protein